MRNTLKGIALTLAGCGSLAAPAAMGGVDSARGQILDRVCQVMEGRAVSVERVREMIRRDPDFDRLIEELRRDVLGSAGGNGYAEDALQDALLKIWRGQPEILLKDKEEIRRYLRCATRQNSFTHLSRDRAESLEQTDAPPSPEFGPTDEVAASDLWCELTARLEPEQLEALDLLVDGAHSERDLAKAQGGTRYAAAQSIDRIERELDRLR